MNRIIKSNQRGGTAIFMTMVILSAILLISLAASDLILNGMKYNRVRYDSAKAFFAAESGAEQIMWGIRSGNITLIPVATEYCNNNDPGDFCFDNASGDIDECVSTASACTGPNVRSRVMTNGAGYAIGFQLESHVNPGLSSTTLLSTGTYQDEVRKIKLTYRSGEN